MDYDVENQFHFHWDKTFFVSTRPRLLYLATVCCCWRWPSSAFSETAHRPRVAPSAELRAAELSILSSDITQSNSPGLVLTGLNRRPAWISSSVSVSSQLLLCWRVEGRWFSEGAMRGRFFPGRFFSLIKRNLRRWWYKQNWTFWLKPNTQRPWVDKG